MKVLKITTDSTHVNGFVDPKLPMYIGVTGGKTYNMGWATVNEGNSPEPEYWEIELYRYDNSPSGIKEWVGSYAGDAIEGSHTTDVQIIMSYSASINGVTPDVLDY